MGLNTLQLTLTFTFATGTRSRILSSLSCSIIYDIAPPRRHEHTVHEFLHLTPSNETCSLLKTTGIWLRLVVVVSIGEFLKNIFVVSIIFLPVGAVKTKILLHIIYKRYVRGACLCVREASCLVGKDLMQWEGSRRWQVVGMATGVRCAGTCVPAACAHDFNSNVRYNRELVKIRWRGNLGFLGAHAWEDAHIYM